MNISLPNSSALSDVLSILDSKIQYIEYQAQCDMHQCIENETADSRPGAANTLMQNFESMLQKIKKQTGDKKLLQIIKCWLREENLSKVMELLDDNTYRKYSEASLEKMLKKSALELMRLQYSH